MKGIFASVLMALASLAVSSKTACAQDRIPEYIQAEKFTQDKLSTVLFSAVVDLHWIQQGNSFWYEYKTNEGKRFDMLVLPKQRHAFGDMNEYFYCDIPKR